jgi:hypothetical protein
MDSASLGQLDYVQSNRNAGILYNQEHHIFYGYNECF